MFYRNYEIREENGFYYITKININGVKVTYSSDNGSFEFKDIDAAVKAIKDGTIVPHVMEK